MLQIGQRVWFPSDWETGVLDSVLEDTNGQVIAYIVCLDDGSKVAVDMQVVELADD
jgi:hypothetical protein